MVVSAMINEINQIPIEALTRTNTHSIDHSTDLSFNSDETEDCSPSSRAITPIELENCVNRMKFNLKKIKTHRRQKRSSLNIPINENNQATKLGSPLVARRCSLVGSVGGRSSLDSSLPFQNNNNRDSLVYPIEQAKFLSTSFGKKYKKIST